MAVLRETQTPPGMRGVRGDGGRVSSPLTVTLTHEEVLIAAFVGMYRNVASLGKRVPWNKQPDSDLWRANIEGAVAEMAVAKALNKFFPAGFRRTDVGEFEVRATTYPDGCLIVRENDSSAKRYILAIVNIPTVTIVGWVWGSDAKRPEYWRAPNGRPGAYFVPQRALKSF